MALQNLASLLLGRRMENCSQEPPSLLKQDFSPLFGDKNHMVFAIPFGMG